MKHPKALTEREVDQANLALSQFVASYYYVMRVHLENAGLIFSAIYPKIEKFSPLHELCEGYVNNAFNEFVLDFYDAVSIFKKIYPEYLYKSDSNIDQVHKIRRHIVAHRGNNWGSEESMAVFSKFSLAPEKMIKVAENAMRELVDELRQRKIKIIAEEQFQVGRKIRRQELLDLLEASPKGQSFLPVPREGELEDFFGLK